MSLQTGWVLGTAPCATPPCTSLVRTGDGGKTWVGIPAPPTELTTDRRAGVRRLRFADTSNGWAFGPDLWATHDGGGHWTRTTLPGVDPSAEVADLAAAAGMVHAAVISSNGVHILSSTAGTDDWKPSPTTVPLGAGGTPSARFALQSSTGWVIDVQRTVIGGARLAAGSWVPWRPPCTDIGGSAFLAAPTSAELVAVCNQGEWDDHPREVRYYRSSDGGTTFRSYPTPVPAPCCVGGLASGSPGTAVAATFLDDKAVLLATFDDGATWTTVYRGGDSSSLIDVGFTSARQGVAIEARGDARAGSLLMTVDGGHAWNAVPIR